MDGWGAVNINSKEFPKLLIISKENLTHAVNDTRIRMLELLDIRLKPDYMVDPYFVFLICSKF